MLSRSRGEAGSGSIFLAAMASARRRAAFSVARRRSKRRRSLRSAASTAWMPKRRTMPSSSSARRVGRLATFAPAAVSGLVFHVRLHAGLHCSSCSVPMRAQAVRRSHTCFRAHFQLTSRGALTITDAVALPLWLSAGRFRLESRPRRRQARARADVLRPWTTCHGGVPEWLKGTDCKSVGFAYAGSNPAPSTSPGGRCGRRKVRV